MKVREIETGRTYDCLVESVELNFDGKYYLRYVIGIENFQGFHMTECVYTNEIFNERFEVIKEVKQP